MGAHWMAQAATLTMMRVQGSLLVYLYSMHPPHGLLQLLCLPGASLAAAALSPGAVVEVALSGTVVAFSLLAVALYLMWPVLLRALALRDSHKSNQDVDVIRRRQLPAEKPAQPSATKAVDSAHPEGTPSGSQSHTVLRQHMNFFDTGGKGYITPYDTYLGFHRIGYSVIFSLAAVVVIHGTFSFATWPDWWPRPSLPIYLNRSHRTLHGSDTNVYDTEGRFTPQRYEEIFSKWATHKTGDGEPALSFSNIQDMLYSLRNVNDIVGVIAARLEWWTLWWIAKDERGLLSKERVRAMYDGSLWRQLEDIAIAKRGYDVAPNVAKPPVAHKDAATPAAEGRKSASAQDGGAAKK